MGVKKGDRVLIYMPMIPQGMILCSNQLTLSCGSDVEPGGGENNVERPALASCGYAACSHRMRFSVIVA